MSQPPPTPWIHIGECPVCVDGLCRVRACQDQQSQVHLYAMCDECEAIWVEPNTDSQKCFPDAESPVCPICALPLFGPQARWARPDDVAQSEDWSLASIFEISDRSDENELSDLLSLEDLTTDVDAPALLAPPSHDPGGVEIEPSASAIDRSKTKSPNCVGDVSYGQDEPKPGC